MAFSQLHATIYYNQSRVNVKGIKRADEVN